MKTSSQLLIASCAMGLAMAASAGTAMNGDDTSRITNGGTGYIGLTQSAGQPRPMPMKFVAALPSGEASTLVGGRPNTNPDAPAWTAMAPRTAELQSMGNIGSARSAAARNPSWGTPD
ncbi:MAG: hypothetical protein ABIR26_17125 [Ramlibacter sp.]